MTDILGMGTSALLSLQRAIATTGHNIANVNTEGYSRQRVNFATLPAQFQGGFYVGAGVTSDSIERFYNEYLVSEVRTRTSSQTEFETFSALSSRLDGLLADPAVGLGPALTSFFSAVQDVANNPGSMPERQVLLAEAQALASRFHYLDSAISNIDSQLNGRIESVVNDINGLSSSIADLNQQVVQATARAGGQPPNDLLDERDRLVQQLSERIGINTFMQSDGSLNVVIGSGHPLVVGLDANQLQTGANPGDSSQLLVGVAGPAGGLTDLSRFLKGGELGALLDFRHQQLAPTRNQLGMLATGIAATVNDQHRLGLDLSGQSGGDFFLPLEPTVVAYTGNSGLSAVNASIDDATALTGADYKMRFGSGQWTLTNTSTNAVQVGAGPFTVDGVTINVTGAPVDGDTFVVAPTRQGASLFSVVLARPEDFAAASPLRSQGALSNTGSSSIAGLNVTSTAGLPLAGPVSLTFNPDALGVGIPGFDVSGIAGGPLAYNPASESNGKQFVLGGFEFAVSGVPQTADILSIENNTSGTGDNRNALAMGSLQTSRLLLGGTASYQDTYGRLVADVAVQTRQAKANAALESALLQQATDARDSVSGVNLDEEAANLMRYQQAYQAAAQMISVADEIFQTLLNATRR